MQKSWFNMWLSVSHSKINHLKCSLAWMRVANGGIAGFTAGSGGAQWNCSIVTCTCCHCHLQPLPMPESGRTSYQCCIWSMPNSDMIVQVGRDHYAAHTNSPHPHSLPLPEAGRTGCQCCTCFYARLGHDCLTVCLCYKGSSKWLNLDAIPPDSGKLDMIGPHQFSTPTPAAIARGGQDRVPMLHLFLCPTRTWLPNCLSLL